MRSVWRNGQSFWCVRKLQVAVCTVVEPDRDVRWLDFQAKECSFPISKEELAKLEVKSLDEFSILPLTHSHTTALAEPWPIGRVFRLPGYGEGLAFCISFSDKEQRFTLSTLREGAFCTHSLSQALLRECEVRSGEKKAFGLTAGGIGQVVTTTPQQVVSRPREWDPLYRWFQLPMVPDRIVQCIDARANGYKQFAGVSRLWQLSKEDMQKWECPAPIPSGGALQLCPIHIGDTTFAYAERWPIGRWFRMQDGRCGVCTAQLAGGVFRFSVHGAATAAKP